jgi:hypothetical protein
MQLETRENWEDAAARLYGLRRLAHNVFEMFCAGAIRKHYVCRISFT